MLTDYFVNVPTCERLRHGMAGFYLDDFTDWHAGRSYAKSTIYSYVYAAIRFLTWAHTSGCEEVSALSWKSLTDYRTHLTASHHREKRAHERGGMRTVAPDASWSFCASADSHPMSVLMNRH